MSPVRALLVTVTVLLAGCGGREGDSDGTQARQAGHDVGRTVTAFTRGLGHGTDQELEVVVELSEELTQLGLSKTVAKLATHDLPPGCSKDKAISVYLMSKKPFQGTLLAKAFNEEGQEIGRTTVEIDFAGDEARYVNFLFPEEMDSQRVTKYVIAPKST